MVEIHLVLAAVFYLPKDSRQRVSCQCSSIQFLSSKVALVGVVFGKPSVYGAVDVAATGLGEAVGDLLGDDLQGLLESGGEWFFDPRSQFGLDTDMGTPFGDFDAELKMRGVVYFVSLTVENMMLNGQDRMARQFLEAVEQSLEHVTGQGAE